MASYILTAAAALGLMTSGVSSTAPTRSAQVLPAAHSMVQATPVKHITRTAAKTEASDSFVGLGLLPLLLGLLAAGAGIAGLATSGNHMSNG